MENVLADYAPLRLRRPARLLVLTSDERLVALVRSGDEGAFEALYDRHHPAILGFCRHMLGTREEAEDAVQHTFLAAFRDLLGNDKPIDLRPWLFAIARNRCLSLLRARRAHLAIELAEPATDGLAATVERREDLRELLADLACLPDDQRAALLLAELGALDHAGIATVLGCPREKVKALVFQARASLAASREARATPCEEIRVELATATGAALRRGSLRRHLRACEGCRAFKAEVAAQRKLLALALPVVPSVALKASVLGGCGAAGTASSAGGTLGVLGTAASSGAGKLTLSLAVAGAVASGGALTAQIEHRQATPPVVPVVSGTGAVPAAPTPLVPETRTSREGRRSRPAGEPGTRSRPQPRSAQPTRRGGAEPAATLPPQPPSSAQPLEPGAVGPPPSTAPTPAPAPAPAPAPTPPVSTELDEHPATPPGHTNGTPPGHAKVPPGHAKTPPGQTGKKTPPGQAKRQLDEASPAPGASTGGGGAQQGGSPSPTPPGSSGDAEPPAGTGPSAPGRSGASHGRSGAAPGHNMS